MSTEGTQEDTKNIPGTLEAFLVGIGYGALYPQFKENDIVDVVAAKELTLEDLVESLGIKTLAAKQILSRLQKAGSDTDVVSEENGQHKNLQLVKLTNETTTKMMEMQRKMEIDSMKMKHEFEIQNMKHLADVESLRQEVKFNKEKEELLRQKDKVEYEGKLAVLEEKNKQKPVIDVVRPGWWNDVYGPWDPLFPYDRFSFPGGTLLTPHFYRVIQSWLGTPRRWALIYKATSHGFHASNFHSQCDGMGPTVTIIKGNGYLFGGYAATSWNSSNSYVTAGGSFIFTLTNPQSTSPQVFYPQNTNHIYCHSIYGPTFGSGHDIYVASNGNSTTSSSINFPSSYNDTSGCGRNLFVGGSNFSVGDIEVFRIL